MFLRLSFLFLLITISNFVYGQSWEIISSSETQVLGIKDIEPQNATIYRISDDDIRNILWSAEKESVKDVNYSSTVISVGLPNGEVDSFKIVQYDMMEPELASKYSDIRTFYGVSLNDKLKRIRIDYTHHGFRAVISAPGEDKTFIDHFQRNDKNTRIVYYKKDYKKVPSWGCNVTDHYALEREASSGARIGDCQLRSYRLAQATTAEYSNYHGATSSSQSGLVLSAVVTVINRVNEVYEPEVAVRLILVNNTDLIFYYNANTDPYTNNNGSTMLNQNITTCNNVIGSANYDIGHVFSTGGGGVAFLGSVCGNSKAGGVTGQPAPVGDPFSIDYVAHEMGHQFGGNHTQFNNCNRVNAAAMEPGSASTIMGYAGICSPNVQNNSDAYFHARSLQEIKTFLSGTGNNCAQIVNTFTNTTPSVTAQSNYSIPISTPFVLTLSASDPENHPLTYAWEQMNSYSANQTMPPASTNTSGPAFRSIFATTSPSRYFPPLTNIIDNTANTWQVLPSVARTMNFRGIARDFTGVAGCNNEINITVSTVNASAGAFSVTSFNSATSWIAGESRTITWNVASTNVSPVNAVNVDILFSIDGGNTFPITLATATPNDGSHTITVPNNLTSQGRIMVRGTNHIFFDLNNNNISITGTPQSFNLTVSPSSFSICAGQTISSNIQITGIGGFNQPVNLSIPNLPSGTTATFSQNPILPGNTATVSISGFTTGGNFDIVVNGVSGSLSNSGNISVSVNTAPSAPSLSFPQNNAVGISTSPTLSWASVSGATSYEMIAAYDDLYQETIATYTGLLLSYQITNPIYNGSEIHWKTRAGNACGLSGWTERAFKVDSCTSYFPENLPVNLPFGMFPVSSTLNIPDKGIVQSVKILNLQGTYNGIQALDFTLSNPQSAQSIFWANPCNRENEYNIGFDDTATLSWPCPPNNGNTYLPSSPLSILNNQQQKGLWTLTLNRNYEESGSLINWGVKTCAAQFCRLTVDHTRQSGPGSLKEAISCASVGDTIKFASSLANDTIDLKGQNLIINKHLIIESPTNQNIFLSTDSQSPTIVNNTTGLGLILKGINILAPNANNGTLIINNGNLTLENVKLYKNTNSTATIINQGLGVLNILGDSKIEND